MKTHGLRRTRFYGVWCAMIQRCTNPRNKRWRSYGGRGIAVDPSWLDFAAFYIDMWPCPPDRQLDRVDNDGPYSALNCRWATRSEQARNRRAWGASGRRGVYRVGRRWRAIVWEAGRLRHLGRFDTEEEAAQAYDRVHAS